MSHSPGLKFSSSENRRENENEARYFFVLLVFPGFGLVSDSLISMQERPAFDEETKILDQENRLVDAYYKMLSSEQYYG